MADPSPGASVQNHNRPPKSPAELLASLTPGQRRCWENERSRDPCLALEAFVRKVRRVEFEQAARRGAGARQRQDAFRRAREAQRFLYTGHPDGEARFVDVRVHVGVPPLARKQRPRYRKQVRRSLRSLLEPLTWLLDGRAAGGSPEATPS